MRQMSSGSVLFENGETADINALRMAVQLFAAPDSELRSKTTDEETRRKRRVSRAMVDAGIQPDVRSSDKMSLQERLTKGIDRGSYDDVIITEEEIEELRDAVEGAEADRNSYEEQVQTQAESVLGEIATVQAAGVET